MYIMTDHHYITVLDHHQTKLKLKKSIYYFILIILATGL